MAEKGTKNICGLLGLIACVLNFKTIARLTGDRP